MAEDNVVRCEGCNKPIKGGEEEYIMTDDAKILNHPFLNNTRDIKCDYCGGPILGPLKRVLDRNYHPKDWICTGCSKQLGDNPFHEHNGWPWCPSCFRGLKEQRRQWNTEEERLAEERRQQRLAKMREMEAKFAAQPKIIGEITLSEGSGFTIDPVTGQKRPANKAPPKK